MSKDLKNQSIIFPFRVKSHILKLSPLEKQPAPNLEPARRVSNAPILRPVRILVQVNLLPRQKRSNFTRELIR